MVCSMLNNFWYAVEFSSEVTAQPKLIRIFDRPIVLYRDSLRDSSASRQGILHGFDNTCPHRGASLVHLFTERGWNSFNVTMR